MAKPASDYQRGDMDIQEHLATYGLVMKLTKWGALVVAAFVLFLTLWFCAGAGFLGALVTAAVVIVLGTLLLRDRGQANAPA